MMIPPPRAASFLNRVDSSTQKINGDKKERKSSSIVRKKENKLHYRKFIDDHDKNVLGKDGKLKQLSATRKKKTAFVHLRKGD